MLERKMKIIPASKSEHRDNNRHNVTPSISGDSAKVSTLNFDFVYDDARISEEIKSGKRDSVIADYEKKQPVKLEAATTNSEKIYKLRVCGYCRVSTDYQEQESSIIAQRRYYEQLIKANAEWEFAGIYWEANESGTEADSRPELQRMLRDCQAGLIDIVLTKSISRFSRNVSDCLNIVRQLSDLGVTVRFEKEGIDTGSMESELMLSLYSAFAEEESKSISTNTNWSIKKRFESGTFRFSNAPYGYDLVDGTFVINEEKAEIVKEIFNRIITGETAPTIARDLNKRGIECDESYFKK